MAASSSETGNCATFGYVRGVCVVWCALCGVVGVVCTVPKSHARQFEEWTPICNNQELLQAAGFGRNAHVLVRPGTGQAIDWLEIGDHTTAHHLHDIGQRVAMMQRYIDTQEDTFEFSVDWARNYINWDIYSR